MTSTGGTTQAFALRYAMWPDRPASRFFSQYESYGEPDHQLSVSFYFWLVRHHGQVILVDTGFHRARAATAWGWQQDRDPIELLGRFGITPDEVDLVVLTHLHSDHMGNAELFRRARFVLAERDLAFWTGPFGAHPALNHTTLAAELDVITDLVAAGRVELVDQETEPVPGLRVLRVGGHTPGQLLVELTDADGRRIVFTSDAAHFYEEFERDRLHHVCTNVEDMLTVYGYLREQQNLGATVVPGHDAEVMKRFVAIDGDRVDLTQPINR